MKLRRILLMMMCNLLLGLLMVGNVLADKQKSLPAAGGFNMNQVEHGRYLARIAGCNDCHTPDYLLSEGNVPEETWLTGDAFGWRGPWGTTYASNLRVFANALTEDQWLAVAHALRTRPPMPWFNLNSMHDQDLKDMYQFLRYLGPKGDAAPGYLPPEIEPKPPYALFPSPPQ